MWGFFVPDCLVIEGTNTRILSAMRPHFSRGRRATLHRLCLAVLSLAAACTTSTSPEGRLRGLYDEAWQDIDEHYAFFDVFHIDWAQARRANAPRSSREADIRTAICGLVNTMRSHHGGLFTPAGVCG